MDLSHMIGLWLVGQSAGVKPGGVGVVYEPVAASRRDAGPGARSDAPKEVGAGVYPFSADRWCLGEANPQCCDLHCSPQSHGLDGGLLMRAGVGLIGELEYGPEGLDGFVPRLFGAVNLPGFVGAGQSAGDLAAASHAAGRMHGAGLNRGGDSIGLSDKLQFVDRFDSQGVLGRARVAGYVERRGEGGSARELVQCCEDVATSSFPVMYRSLQDYLRFQVSAQVAGNGYDDLAGALAKSERPTHAVVLAGHVENLESRISDVESMEIKAGDVCHSVVYDAGAVTPAQIEQALRVGDAGVLEREGVSWLRQVVV